MIFPGILLSILFGKTQEKEGRRCKLMSQIEKAEEEIWQQIRSGKLRPGQRVTETGIAKDANVSSGVVREVFQKLTDQGVIETERYKGSRLVSLSEGDVKQLHELRRLLEPLALKQAREKATPEDIKQLRSLMAEMREVRDTERYDALHSEFHKRVWELTKNRHLVRALEAALSPLFAFHHVLRSAGKGHDLGGATHKPFLDTLENTNDLNKAALNKVVDDHIESFDYQISKEASSE